MKRSKELALCGMLTALAIILSIVERMFPLDAIIPIPGVKLGLANVVTLFALTRLGLRDSLAVVVVRVTLASLLMGSVTAFLFSLFGGLLALFAMWALLHAEGKLLLAARRERRGRRRAQYRSDRCCGAVDENDCRTCLSALSAAHERSAWPCDRPRVRGRADAHEKN